MPEESLRKTKEQARAKLAYDLITQQIKTQSFAKEYKSYVSSAPTLIQTNGLINTFAFYRTKAKSTTDYDSHDSKSKSAYKKLINHIQLMVNDDLETSIDDLLVKLTECGVNEYRYCTNSVLANLIWLKRFAEAELED